MTTQSIASRIKVIDTDSHVTEPMDLWTSRLPQKWQELAPKVDKHPSGDLRWRIGDRWLSKVAQYSQAGWGEYPPSCPPTLEESDQGAHDPVARLERLDEYGVWAQILYPNLIAFEAYVFMNSDRDFALACTKAYNDFLTDFASVNPERLLPLTMVPFWDVDASIKEIERCAAMGHHGLLFGDCFERGGLPVFTDEHWDPIYAVAQDMNHSINFHVSVGSSEEGNAAQVDAAMADGPIDPRGLVVGTTMAMFNQGGTVAKLLLSGLLDRFPRLNFVSVESGLGYVPYLLESLDWNYKNYGMRDQYPNTLLPSEYFRRQVYGSFWFERGTLPMLELYPDNFMFETDYPHPTSLSPGPKSAAENPIDHIEAAFAGLPDDIVRKALHDNAARLYKLT